MVVVFDAHIAPLPMDHEGWKVQAMTAAGMRRVTARRAGTTFVIVGSPHDGWQVTKLRGGMVQSDGLYRHLPGDWPRVVAA